MTSLHEIKQRSIADTPLLTFDCELPSGLVEHWSTHNVQINGTTYHGRILKHDLFEIRAASDGGIDASTRISITLANADAFMSQIARDPGFKGAKIAVQFVFVDASGAASCDPVTVFRGVANPPDEITESYARVTFSNRLSLQRLLLPEIRIQRRCAWMFPSNATQRAEAIDGGSKGRYSRFFRCGYSAGLPDGKGNLQSDGTPFTSCDYGRKQCVERGMFDKDSAQHDTKRFGGVEFVPSSIQVKTYGEKTTHLSNILDNEAKYNDFVPLIYGTAWYRPPIIFARNDGNLTHLEILLGMGEVSDLLKVLVNGFELPTGSSAQNPTSTGWFNLVSRGERNGSFNQDVAAGSSGDPYGSLAVASVVVPNRITDGSSLPRIEVLLEGSRLPVYDSEGAAAGFTYTNNPAWIILDILRRSGWAETELDLPSFAATAAYCDEPIETTDLNGNAKQIPRFQCNLVVRQRRSAADLLRGIRNNAALQLTYGNSGALQLTPESSVAMQQPTKPEGSNSKESLNGGWPSYEFGDGTNGFSDILRRNNGEPSLRLWSRNTAESPNRYTLEFQDEFNEYQQDSLSLVDLEDTLVAGQEISASLPVLGIPNFNQAGRIARLFLDRSIRGNLFVQFETGLRGIGLRPGQLIAVSYEKEGFNRELFRIVSIAPSLNYRSTMIVAQRHRDEWYVGDPGMSLLGGGRQPAFEVGVPRPLLGSAIRDDGGTDFEIEEKPASESLLSLSVKYTAPAAPSLSGPSIPLISLSASVDNEGGSLKGGRSYYYAVSAVSPEGEESALSFTVRANITAQSDTNRVLLRELSFAPGSDGFHVYRGSSPARMFRIAEHQAIASTFSDSGLETLLISPPDRNFDHANFYWRMELSPEYPATIHSGSTIGSDGLGMQTNEFQGKTVRITKGSGEDQERTVTSNDAHSLQVSPEWSTVPDTTSKFVVCDSGWQYGALSKTSPAIFSVPARTDATIHVCGRSANVNDKECAVELSPVTRYTLGGAGDSDIPAAPAYGIFVPGRGIVEISGVAFSDLKDTHTIQAASCLLHYHNELSGPPALALSAALDGEATSVLCNHAPSATSGALIQVGTELMRVQTVDGSNLTVERGVYGSSATAQAADSLVYILERKMFILPFARGFFGSPASGSYSYSLVLPDVRIVAAEMFVTNAFGNSAVKYTSFADTVDLGLRTLSGGQFSLQVDGPIAIQSDAVPAVTIEADHAVRDVFATVATPPGGDSLQVRVTHDGVSFCELIIPAGQTESAAVSGTGLPALQSGWKLGLDIVQAGGAGSQPPTDLTVTLRL